MPHHQDSHSAGSVLPVTSVIQNPFMGDHRGNRDAVAVEVEEEGEEVQYSNYDQDISLDKENQLPVSYLNAKTNNHASAAMINPLSKGVSGTNRNSFSVSPNRNSISSFASLPLPKHRSALSDVTSRVENKQNPASNNNNIMNNNNTNIKSNVQDSFQRTDDDQQPSMAEKDNDSNDPYILKIRSSEDNENNNNRINNIPEAKNKSNQYRHEDMHNNLLADPTQKTSQEDIQEQEQEGDVNEYSSVEEDDNNNILKEPLQPKHNDSTEQLLRESYNKYYRSVPDPMDEDTYDIVMVAELSNDIFDYLKQLEEKYRPNPNYIHYQPNLKWSYRRILLDWLIEVHNRFQLLPETLYLTVNIIDRFLSKKTIVLDKFQLVGASALFIASKYEEINCPTLKEIVYMVNGTYTREDVIEAERYIIDTLEFEIGWPGPMSFLRRISKADDYEYDIRTLAKYLLESTLMDSRLVSAQPSWLAAGSYFLSRVILGYNTWSQRHIYYSGYTQQQLIPLASIILDNCKDAPAHHNAIYEKYSHRRFGTCSQIVTRWILSTEKMIHERSD